MLANKDLKDYEMQERVKNITHKEDCWKSIL